MSTVDTDALPSVQHLILNELASRVRTGERAWTFRTREGKAIEALAKLGLVNYKSAPTYGHLLVWFTEEGKKTMLDTGYITPMQAELDRLKAAAQMRLEENSPDANGVVRHLSQGEVVRLLREVAAERARRAKGAPESYREMLEVEAGNYETAAAIAAGSVWDAEMLDARP